MSIPASMSSPELQIEVDPAEAGLDVHRLERIDRHFGRYVDDGRLAGWLALVARAGRIVHLAHAGHRDAEAGRPVSTDTLWRIFSMTKPITTVAALSLWEEGAFELTDPVSRYLPAFADTRVYTGGSDSQRAPSHDRARAHVASDDPHLRADLRLSPRASGRRDLPGPGL